MVDSTASLDLAMDMAYYFDLESLQIKNIVKEVGRAVARWKQEALKLRIKKEEIDRMATAFEHEDLKKAIC